MADTQTDIIIAYHFVGSTLRDGRPVPPDGEWLIHEGPVVMCKAGLHAARHPFDALLYAPGDTLCRVECADIVQEDADKLVCRRRRIVARIDATDLCRAFARSCARDVISPWDAPEVVRRWLETGDESLRAAAEVASWSAEARAVAAWAAARAAWAAARAARAAARAAARLRFAQMVEAAFAEANHG